MSVYQGPYYYMTGVQVHELGHNFGLYHSGGLDGKTYTDHTGMMGNPLYSDDVGKMCYNAAKNWQIGWYDAAKLLINPSAEPSTTVNLVGIAEYNNRPNNEPVTVKIETGLTDKFYVGFNRATGANAQNDEADNEVTIVKANAAGTSQSYLQAHLIQGESHTIVNFAGTGNNLIITANTIVTSTSPGRANVSIVYQSGPTAAPTFAPTSSPTASPTASPTVPPTFAPTSSPTASPTASPTKSPTPAPTEPTPAPTTAAPTKSPTPVPTQNCTQLGKTQCQALSYCLWSGRFKTCSFNTSSPVSSPVAEPPVSSPVAEPPTGGPGPSQCVASGQPCPTDGNTCCFGCQLKGKNANTCK